MGRVILIRHTEVAAHWKGRCYGRSDVGLSSAGRLMARDIAHRLALSEGALLVTSPLRRARYLAGLVAQVSSQNLVTEPRLSECNFGTWEGRSWNAIFAETGSAMMGMVTAPDSFRPGGGETTYELRDRAMAWLESVARHDADVTAIAHGGPVAAIRGTLAGVPADQWPALVPAYGEQVEISL